MKKAIITAIFFISSIYSFSQITETGGKVGIGTTSPDKLLTIKTNEFIGWEYTASGSGSYHTISGGGINPMSFTVNPFSANDPIFKFNGNTGTKVTILNGGNVGIGTDQPTKKLHLEGAPWTGIKIRNTTTSGGRGIKNDYLDGNDDGWTMFYGGHYTGQPLRFAPISQGSQGITTLSLLDNGSVGIGTETPAYKLDVIGTIRAREIKVDLNGADFVFEDDYNLKSLHEVEAFVIKNKHLPDILPAEEMEKDGTELGELNIKLLQKIEELTLYMIEQNKKTETLIEKVETLESENKLLKNEINTLKTQ